MYNYSKDGITVYTWLDTRTINADGRYPVKVRVNYQRKPKNYPTGKYLTKEEWELLSTGKSRSHKEIRESIENSFSLVRDNVEFLAERGDFSFDLLNTRLGKGTGDTLNTAIRAKIAELESEERIGTMQFYQCTLVMLEEFAGKSVTFNSVNVQWLQKCERKWLETRSVTTVGMHFRNIRAMMNEAKKAGIIKESQYPFGKGRFEIKTGEGRKKALNKAQIKSIYHYSDGNETTERYKDLWMCCYLCNGINVTDLIKLKYSNIIDGEICFVRQKTERTAKSRKEIRVVISPEIQAIIDRWGNKPCPDSYIFPYMKGDETAKERKALTRDVVKRINKRMKKIGEALGIGDITTYTARHCFATTLKRSGASISYISESLGHSDLKTTESYLASFEKEDRRKNSLSLTNFL